MSSGHTMARGIWDLYQAHPWLLHVNQSRPVLHKAMATGNYPEVAGLPGDSFTISGREALEFGLRALLDGLESFLATRTRTSGGPGRALARSR